MVKVVVIIVMVVTSIVTSVVYHVTQKADIQYYQGHRYFEKGEYVNAAPFYQRAIAANPSHFKSLKDIGFVYQWTNRHAEAIAAFSKALSIRPKDKRVKIALAETLSWERSSSSR
jgi:tetratricopeptide (TPR) repeat protein